MDLLTLTTRRVLVLLVPVLLSGACSSSGNSPPPAEAAAGAASDPNASDPNASDPNTSGIKLASSVVELAASVAMTDPDIPVGLIADSVKEALFESGFGVRRADGFVLVGDPSLGIAFEAWDTLAIATGLQEGLSLTLDNYVATWESLAQAQGSSVDAAALKQALLADIASAATSKNDSTRAMGQLLVALGRQNPTPYDLLDPKVDGGVPLDALQMGIMTFGISAKVWQSAHNADGSIKVKSLPGSLPCTMTDTEGLVLDASAVATGTAWGAILDQLVDSASQVAEKFGNATTLANAALVYVKLAWTMAVFQATVVAEPNPLERTLTRSPGAAGKVKAHFALDGIGHAQLLNCLRPALNLANIDFSLPQDGPLVGSIAEWQVEAAAKDNVIQTVGGDVLSGKTDANGDAILDIQGAPQKEDLSSAHTVEVQRRPRVRVTTNLKNKNFKQDLVDASAGVAGLGALVGLPAELLNRMPLLFNRAVTVVVNDHKKVEGDIFTIVGEYADPIGQNFSSMGLEDQKAKKVIDQFEVIVEVKIDAATGEGKLEVLSWNDGQASYEDTFKPMEVDGEGCTVTTTALGRFDAFTRKGEVKGDVSLIPGSAGADVAYVALVANGYAQGRGFDLKNDDASCPDSTVEQQDKPAVALVTFDSSQLHVVGAQTQLDTRQNGAGWLYTITYSDTAD